MKHVFSFCICLIVAGILPQNIFAQDSLSIYNKNEVFDPLFLNQPATEFRSANGAPGPKYWQNSVNYTIRATLNEPDTTLNGDVTINSVSYTHLRAHETGRNLVCRLLL